MSVIGVPGRSPDHLDPLPDHPDPFPDHPDPLAGPRQTRGGFPRSLMVPDTAFVFHVDLLAVFQDGLCYLLLYVVCPTLTDPSHPLGHTSHPLGHKSHPLGHNLQAQTQQCPAASPEAEDWNNHSKFQFRQLALTSSIRSGDAKGPAVQVLQHAMKTQTSFAKALCATPLRTLHHRSALGPCPPVPEQTIRRRMQAGRGIPRKRSGDWTGGLLAETLPMCTRQTPLDALLPSWSSSPPRRRPSPSQSLGETCPPPHPSAPWNSSRCRCWHRSRCRGAQTPCWTPGRSPSRRRGCGCRSYRGRGCGCRS